MTQRPDAKIPHDATWESADPQDASLYAGEEWSTAGIVTCLAIFALGSMFGFGLALAMGLI